MQPVILPRKLRPSHPPEPPGRRLLKWASFIGAAGAGLATLMGFCGRLGWLFDLCSNFPVHYFWVLAASAAGLAGLRRYKSAVAPALVALVNLALIVPLYVPQPPPAADSTIEKLRILSLNVHTTNREYRLVCDYVRQKRPEVALFFEVNDAWLKHLEQLQDDFPYHRVRPHPDNPTLGLAIYSHLPLWDLKFEDLGDGNDVVGAEVIVESQSFKLLGVHTASPKSPERAARRNRQLVRLAEIVRAEEGPVVLMGDLNATPWSPAYRDLLQATGLRDTRFGFGVQATWPVPLGSLGIPIDHCLVSPQIGVRRHAAGEDVNSDHFPLVVDLWFPVERPSAGKTDSPEVD